LCARGIKSSEGGFYPFDEFTRRCAKQFDISSMRPLARGTGPRASSRAAADRSSRPVDVLPWGLNQRRTIAVKSAARAIALLMGLSLTLPAHARSCPPGSASGAKSGSSSVRSTVRRDSVEVVPHRRTAPDKNCDNTTTTKPHANPYIGTEGTRVTPPVKP